MKIILSRKGFDSGNAHMPSPILPDGTLLSLPIPRKNDKIRYKDIFYKDTSYEDTSYKEISYNKIIYSLSKYGMTFKNCHLDPDLRYKIKPNRNEEPETNWRGLFGASVAQTSLSNALIKEGSKDDILFLFFGWFRSVDEKKYEREKIFCFDKQAHDLHIIFGYLQVSEMLLDKAAVEEYIKKGHYDAKDHPHRKYFEDPSKKNCIYVASKKLTIFPELENLSGWGCLKKKSETDNSDYSVVLTDMRQEPKKWHRSSWKLPKVYFCNDRIYIFQL
jgi:hypothetical protein